MFLQSDFFEYALNGVFLYNGLTLVKIVDNAILDRVLIKNYRNEIVSQFHIRRADDKELSSSDVIFTEGYFNISQSFILDRFVLSIWMNNRTASHICLIFADHDRAENFLENISSYLKPSPNTQYDRRNDLLHIDMTSIMGLC